MSKVMDAEVTNVGVDWLTMTSRQDKVGYAWYEVYKSHAADNQKEDLGERQFSNGFYSGLKCAGLHWGYSDKLGYILIASGSTANELFDRLSPHKKRVTRIDLCVDVYKAVPSSVAKNEYEMWGQSGRKVPSFSLYEKGDGAMTLYVGSRQSQQYGRLYDKGVESGIAGAGKLWRYEVEFKKPLADSIYDTIKKPLGSRASTIQNLVLSWYGRRGVDVSWISPISTEYIIKSEVRVTTKERKLAWLRTQVAPSVSELIEAGYGKDVLTSLLLDRRKIEEIFKHEP